MINDLMICKCINYKFVRESTVVQYSYIMWQSEASDLFKKLLHMPGKYIKLAHVVKLKLIFTEWFFYNLMVLIKLCKIRHLNLDKALLFLKKPDYLSEKMKNLTSSNAVKLNIFSWNFAHVSYLMMSTIGCSGFFYIV